MQASGPLTVRRNTHQEPFDRRSLEQRTQLILTKINAPGSLLRRLKRQLWAWGAICDFTSFESRRWPDLRRQNPATR
jgi:hypothetical protein